MTGTDTGRELGSAFGWIRTAARVLPRLPSLIRRMRPTFDLDSANRITREFLREHGVSGLIWDVDGTLMAHHADAVDPALADRMSDLLGDPDLRHSIVSNCETPRYEELGRIFPRVPIVLGLEGPDGPVFSVRLGGDVRLVDRHGRSARPPERARLLRKPSGDLALAGLSQLAGLSADEVLFVGDQYLTDIASANQAGIRSAKVPTLRRESFPRAVRISQSLERTCYRIFHGRGR